MAIIGKPRGNKRSSAAGSCSSTVTTLLLLSVCVLGVWILTSNSTVSPQKTATSFDSEPRSVKRHRKVPFDAIITPQDKLVDLSINTSDSEDKHRGFPTDVVEHDDGLKAGNDPDTIQETSRDDKYKVAKDENPGGGGGGGGLTETEAEVKPESTSDVDDDDDAESLNDSDVGKQEAEEQQEEAREEQEMEISSSVIEDEQHGSEEEVQKRQKIQESEDSIDDQRTEEATGNEYDQQSDTEDKQTESGGEDDIRELEDNQEQEITDEEQEKRMENQQQEEEEKEHEDDDGPIESHSIAAETRAQVESREARDVRKKMKQAKISIESTIANTTTPKKPSKTGNSTMVKNHSSENQMQVDIKVTANVDMYGYKWELCNVSAGTDYIPCLDNEISIRNLHHQERHCPKEAPMCLVPLPKGYKTPIPWPKE